MNINVDLLSNLIIPKKIKDEFKLEKYSKNNTCCVRFDNFNFNSIYFSVYSKKFLDKYLLKFNYLNDNFEFNSACNSITLFS